MTAQLYQDYQIVSSNLLCIFLGFHMVAQRREPPAGLEIIGARSVSSWSPRRLSLATLHWIKVASFVYVLLQDSLYINICQWNNMQNETIVMTQELLWRKTTMIRLWCDMKVDMRDYERLYNRTAIIIAIGWYYYCYMYYCTTRTTITTMWSTISAMTKEEKGPSHRILDEKKRADQTS